MESIGRYYKKEPFRQPKGLPPSLSKEGKGDKKEKTKKHRFFGVFFMHYYKLCLNFMIIKIVYRKQSSCYHLTYELFDAITYILIAFVSISLIVSSIMIGVITYISVLERTKEIGVLRAMGASKRDVARVFNAETVIIGFVSGMLGIIITILLNIPISLIIKALAGIGGVSSLPVAGGITLVIISVVLTLIAGIIPSGMASKKDPVIALRSE